MEEKSILKKITTVKNSFIHHKENMYISSIETYNIQNISNINKLEKYINKPIPEDLKNFFLNFPLFWVQFGYYQHNKNHNFYIQGYCKLLTVKRIIEKIEYFKEAPDYGGIDYLSDKYIPLSDLGDEHLVVMEFKGNKTILHLLMPDGQLFFLDTSLEDYYEKVFLTRGMFLWEAYIAPDITEEFLEKDYDGFYQNMEHLFPEVNLKSFLHKKKIEKIESINDKLRRYNYLKKLSLIFEENTSQNFNVYSPIFPSKIFEQGVGRLSLLRLIELNITGSLPTTYKVLMLYFGRKGLKLNWFLKDNKKISGGFHLWGLYDTFRNEEDDTFTNDALLYLDLKKEDYPDLENVYIFFQQDEVLVGFYMIEEGVAELCIIDSEEKIIRKLDWGITDFETFFEELLNTKGLNNWLNQNADFGQDLKEVFDDVDLTRYS